MPGRDRVPSFQLPIGTTAERDGSYNLTTEGNIFYNTDTSNVEICHVNPSNTLGWRDLVVNNKERIDISGKLVITPRLDISGNLVITPSLDASYNGSLLKFDTDRAWEFTTGREGTSIGNTTLYLNAESNSKDFLIAYKDGPITARFNCRNEDNKDDCYVSLVEDGGAVAIGDSGSQDVPFVINSSKTKSIDGSTYTMYCRWYRGSSGNWYIGSNDNTSWNHNLYWFANTNTSGNPLKMVIKFENDQSKGTNVNQNTFTGQHRNIVKNVNPVNIESYIGLIVTADNNDNIKVNGGVERGLHAITINETIPYVSVTNKSYDKKVFGVISASEDPETRKDTYGRVTSMFIKEDGDDRIFINSLGEGAMWISNQNGSLESGDYVTSSNIPGYGMKQSSEFLANYTVAKMTMDCDFQETPRIKYKIKTEFKTVNYFRDTSDQDFITEKKYNLLDDETKQKYILEQHDEHVNVLDEDGQLQWEDSGETEAPYKVRYLLPNSTQISEEEYNTRALANEEVYKAAFIGCTYHCG